MGVAATAPPGLPVGAAAEEERNSGATSSAKGSWPPKPLQAPSGGGCRPREASKEAGTSGGRKRPELGAKGGRVPAGLGVRLGPAAGRSRLSLGIPAASTRVTAGGSSLLLPAGGAGEGVAVDWDCPLYTTYAADGPPRGGTRVWPAIYKQPHIMSSTTHH